MIFKVVFPCISLKLDAQDVALDSKHKILQKHVLVQFSGRQVDTKVCRDVEIVSLSMYVLFELVHLPSGIML